MKNGTARVSCTCSHEQQDKLYGKGIRVANATSKQDTTSIEVRCTVCGKLHRVSLEKVK
jgi:redox-regulated HSP33 family molecular chaperone